MGISVQASGIKVEKNKYYLVNLNADPSLNELLVYYLKDRTLVGGSSSADIQLSGLGIQPEHCQLLVEGGGLHMEPLGAARCFVNGTPVVSRVRLGHADRILWGNHHFFRVNCPKAAEQDSGYSTAAASEPQTPAQPIDYNFARDEIMLNELSNDPIQTAISRLEKQHEEDKQVALEKQRQEYERQFQQLRNILSPSTPYPPYAYDPLKLGKMTACTPTTAARVERWAAERDDTFKRSLGRLKADILRANALVQEANFLAEEMKRNTRFSVTLQIPPQNLSPNRKRGAFVSEPAIMVKRPGRSGQVWSMEKLDNKLVDMRDMYDDWRRLPPDTEVRLPSTDAEPTETAIDPFYESQENHNLIGVANVFLEALFHDVTLDYHTPIISQQGEVAGRLQVEISRVAGQFPQDRICEAASDSSGDMRDDDDPVDPATQQVTIRVAIKQATGLPPSLSHFVFCQYSVFGGGGSGEPVVVPPVVSADSPAVAAVPAVPAAAPPAPLSPRHQSLMTFRFDHKKDFTIPLTEEFIEHCAEGALSIEVWGHRSAGFSRARGNWEVEQQQLAKARSLADRWTELTRKIELWVEIHELNDNGEYAPVEVVQRNDVWTGGVYQVRQGQQRRIAVRVRPAHNSGTLPLVCQQILSIEVGSVSVRSRLQMPLDSYQDEDLAVLRERWSDALFRRRQHLHAQLQKLVNMSPSMKSERDNEREQSLVEQWVSLTEERNAVLVPSPGSPIPGAPAAWVPPLGMEHHIPVLFLDLNADDLTTHPSGEEVTVAGLHSILPKEHGNKFYELQILHHHDKDVSAVASWDSSIHDSQYLNRITEANERVYLILKTTVRLSHPAPMDLILRKRLGLNIYKRQSLTDRIRKKIVSYYADRTDQLTQTGVTYEVVSNIPKASEELEERESLAQIAATGEEASAADGETYIEKYTRGVSAVESILTLDRLRQSVAVKELEQARGQPITMRKTASVPNFSQLMRLDSSFESLAGLASGRAGSMADLADETPRRSVHRHSYAAPSHNDPEIPTPTKPFGLASPASGKLGLRMTTLHEEPGRRNDDDSHSEPESAPADELATPHTHQRTRSRATSRGFLPTSKTLDSLHELACERVPNKNSPSISSSGYGSQAVSSTNLTNDDTLSIRSMSVDETPDFDKTMDYTHITHITRTKTSMAGLRNEITELRNDINDLKNDIVESKHELDDSMFEKAKTPVLTPGSRNRINPFLRDCEDAIKEEESKGQLVDPLGAIPVESAVLPSNKSVESAQLNGEARHEQTNNVSHDASHDTSFGEAEVESVSSEQSSHDTERSREASSVGESDSASTGPDQPVVKTQLPAGKVVRRRAGGSARTGSRQTTTRPRSAHEPALHHTPASSTERIVDDECAESALQPWMSLGESVALRLSSSTGVIAYTGPTHFASGTWIGVELDAPTGKNDGSVGGTRYFECRARHGIFVRPDKLVHDRRGRSARAFRDTELKRAQSKGSQAVSSTNLTNDDTLSIRSMSVDETPDFDKTMDYTHITHITRTKTSMAGLRNEITELRNDINDLKNDIVESKHELDDSMFEKAKTPVLTPGSRNRINPFLRDCEDAIKEEESKGQLVDPLGAIPVESAVLPSNKSVESAQLNGEARHEQTNNVSHDASHDTSFGEAEVESVSSEQSSHDTERSREASSVGESDSASTGPDQPVVKTQLPAGKVVRRRAGGSARTGSRQTTTRPRSAHEPALHHTPASSTERIVDDECAESALQPWMSLGESVALRLSSSTGVIAYTGPTHFASGTWIGVELDAPTGKNDGSVGGTRYFECRARHGIFVRPDKLVHDRRGRSARAFRDTELKRAQSKEGLHNLHRSRSRGDSINAVGTKTRNSK
uniref:CAP-Gly domain-containing protein n=1 Tax=Heliothis virescens TaxID=7102 RepID=A0A2A4JK86_HELVI